MSTMQRYQPGSPDYAEAFATLLRSYGSREHLYSVVRGLAVHLPDDAVAIDWGAGTGDLTRILLEHVGTVYSVEPSAAMRSVLATNCPAARIIEGTVMNADPPHPAQVAVLSHVLYHVPQSEWEAHVIRAANFLSPDGMLLIVLKDAESGCNSMLEHFGAPRFDLATTISPVLHRHKEFEFAFSRSHHAFRTNSFAETLQIARLIMSDPEADAFSALPTEARFEEYVRTHFWDGQKKVGGWQVGDAYCVVRRNPRWVEMAA